MPAFLLNPRIIGALALALAFGGLYLWGSYHKSGRLKAELALETCKPSISMISLIVIHPSSGGAVTAPCSSSA